METPLNTTLGLLGLCWAEMVAKLATALSNTQKFRRAIASLLPRRLERSTEMGNFDWPNADSTWGRGKSSSSVGSSTKPGRPASRELREVSTLPGISIHFHCLCRVWRPKACLTCSHTRKLTVSLLAASPLLSIKDPQKPTSRSVEHTPFNCKAQIGSSMRLTSNPRRERKRWPD